MISFEDPTIEGGAELKNYIWNKVQPIIEEWVGRKVHPTSLYGIRVYSSNAVLATHVDRLPLVSSCIIQVDQDVDEPWPVEVYSHDGKAYNVTMKPGDMVLYESHTVLHGRPYRLIGRHYANVFVHYEPDDHSAMNKMDREPNKHLDKEKFAKMVEKHGDIGGHEQFNVDEEALERFRDVDELEEIDEKQTPAHLAAREGQLSELVAILRRDENLLNQADVNGAVVVLVAMLVVMCFVGWLPIHEAARGGHVEVIKYLIEMGADLGTMTKHGGTPLWWARRMLPAGHSALQYLEQINAPDLVDNEGLDAD